MQEELLNGSIKEGVKPGGSISRTNQANAVGKEPRTKVLARPREVQVRTNDAKRRKK